MQALRSRPGRLGHHQSKSPEGSGGPKDLRLGSATGFPGGPWACSLLLVTLPSLTVFDISFHQAMRYPRAKLFQE